MIVFWYFAATLVILLYILAFIAMTTVIVLTMIGYIHNQFSPQPEDETSKPVEADWRKEGF